MVFVTQEAAKKAAEAPAAGGAGAPVSAVPAVKDDDPDGAKLVAIESPIQVSRASEHPVCCLSCALYKFMCHELVSVCAVVCIGHGL